MMIRQGSRETAWAIGVLLWTAAVYAAPPEAGQVPDTDFLEFLGTWHTGDDRWVDPFRAGDVTGPVDSQKAGQPGRTREVPQLNRREGGEEPGQQGIRPIDSPREKKP